MRGSEAVDDEVAAVGEYEGDGVWAGTPAVWSGAKGLVGGGLEERDEGGGVAEGGEGGGVDG